MKVIEWIIHLASGEWMLESRSNGGAIIILRTAWISAIVYLCALSLVELSDPKSLLEFSWPDARKRISETVPWLGAIIGAVYVALYARFSSQWQYLAQLYNQLMQVSIESAEKGDSEILNKWRAAFIEDAYCVHLACKPMFAAAINGLLKDPSVMRTYQESTIDANKHLKKLQECFKGRQMDVFELGEG